jgi:hypothetical protein
LLLFHQLVWREHSDGPLEFKRPRKTTYGNEFTGRLDFNQRTEGCDCRLSCPAGLIADFLVCRVSDCRLSCLQWL